MWTQILLKEPLYCPHALHPLLDPRPCWQSIKLLSLSCTITVSLVIVRSGGGRNVGSVALELRRAPGSGLWDWEKGPWGRAWLRSQVGSHHQKL